MELPHKLRGTEYKNQWQKENCDRVNLTLPKGRKAELRAHAAAQGESVNGFINRAILEAMERDGLERPTGTAEGVGVSLYHDAQNPPRDHRGLQSWGRVEGADTMALPAEKNRHTFADVLTWDEKDRIEIIESEAVMTSPPSRIHQEISVAKRRNKRRSIYESGEKPQEDRTAKIM